MIKQRVILTEVQYVKCNWKIYTCILNSKIKPLCITFRVRIVLQRKAVFIVIYLHSIVEVSTLKTGFKLQSTISRARWSIVWVRSLGIGHRCSCRCLIDKFTKVTHIVLIGIFIARTP